MAMNIPLPAGMTVDKEDSDSDPEAVAARVERRAARDAREVQEAAEEKAAAERAAAEKAAKADIEPLLRALCPEEAERSRVEASLGTALEGPRPEGLEERLEAARELRGRAKEKFQASELRPAIDLWLSAVHCADFTPNQLSGQADATVKFRAEELLAPVLSNLAIAQRRLGDLAAARRAADVGIDLVQELPYKDSKATRAKLRFNRALVLGEQRDFKGAKDEAIHVLQMEPANEEVQRMIRNCSLAIQRESGPQEQRWKGPLTAQLVQKGKQQGWSSRWKLALGLGGPLLALGVAWAMR